MNNTSIYLCFILLAYYLWMQVIADFVRIGSVINSPHIEFERLRTKYGVNIKTFQKNTNHRGFAWFRTLFLNENLLRIKNKQEKDPYYTLKFTFHHEHYHLQKHHKRNVLVHRFLFSMVPLLLNVHWIAFVVVFVASAYGMYYLKEKVYERNANNYAKKQMNGTN